MSGLPKIVAVLGQTASGKTDMGIYLAKKFNGETVNFDSRQIYKQMNIGTAKPIGEWRIHGDSEAYFVEDVPHHLMDIVNPDREFSMAIFKRKAMAVIDCILERSGLPILVGGTGMYLWSVVDNLDVPRVGPDIALRKDLEKMSLAEQVAKLRDIDSLSADKIDLKNPRRVLRALEVAMIGGQSFAKLASKLVPKYEVLQIGIDWPMELLYKRINERCDAQMREGLLEEVSGLSLKYDWNLPSMSGIGYRQLGYYLRKEMSLGQSIEVFKRDTRKYAKRQMTWFKRDKRIVWLDGPDKGSAEKLVKNFIN